MKLLELLDDSERLDMLLLLLNKKGFTASIKEYRGKPCIFVYHLKDTQDIARIVPTTNDAWRCDTISGQGRILALQAAQTEQEVIAFLVDLRNTED